MEENNYFEVRNLSKRFGGLLALDELSFSLDKGRINALIGPNGAGKTTVFNTITGFLRADNGKIIYKNVEITNLSPIKIVSWGIVRTFQEVRLFLKLKAIDNVVLGIQKQKGENALWALLRRNRVKEETRRNVRKAEQILSILDLTSSSKELAENLSYGEQKLLIIARLLATDADLLLFDEPTAGLTSQEIEKVLEVIRSLKYLGKTVFLIDHNMGAIMDVADHIIVLDHGRKIAEGRPAEIQANDEVIQAYLGMP